MYNLDKVYILIRAYNECKMIGVVLQDLLQAGFRHICVVNDGSLDCTAQEVKKFPQVTLINHPMNRGGGAALATGLEYLQSQQNCDYVVTFDADGQHNVSCVQGMLGLVEKNKNIDVVLGSRFLIKTNTNVPVLRRMVLFLGTIFLRLMYGLKITDAHNGLKVIKKSAIGSLIPRNDDFSYASEMLYGIKKARLHYVEYPTHILYTEYSMRKGQSSWNAFKIAFLTIMHKIKVLVFE
jgi:glycosyltransferase involved in cell wall biosynthesis